MRVLLQHNQTKRYLGRCGNWTDDPETALAFLDEIRARDYSIYRRLSQTEVVVRQDSRPVEGVRNSEATGAEEETHFYSHSLIIAKENSSHMAKEGKTKVNRARLTAEPLMTHQMAETVGERSTPVREKKRRPAATPAQPAQCTRVEAKINVGFGNAVFIRGQGDGLSWDKGQPLECLDGQTWVWSTHAAKDKLVFKLLLNDQIWSKGEDLVAEAGTRAEVSPLF